MKRNETKARDARYAGLALCALLFALFLFHGCTELDDYYATEGSEVNAGELYEVMGLEDLECETTDLNCICMVCEGGESDSLNPYHWFYDLPLTGGECRFQEECIEEFFRANMEDEEDTSFFPFMFGMGSNFGEFNFANAYCNTSSRLAVRWLVSREGFEYPMPAHERAECFLDKNAIPAYLLFSNGTMIEVERAEEIAAEFKDAGPVILSSEFGFDPNDYAAIDAAASQAFAMKDACPNCLIALSPRLEYNRTLDAEGNPRGYAATYEALDYVFANYPEAYSKIDIIGVGLNSHYAPNCIGASLIGDGINFSKHALLAHGKPSLWAYVLLDEGEPNSGGDLEGTCTWSQSEITKAYGDLYKYAPALVRNGVIGVAPYSLFGLEGGALECENCGMMSPEGETYPQHAIWFSLCQSYYNNRGFLFNVFSPEPCADCSFANNFNLYQLSSFRSGSSPTAEELEPVLASETFYRCNGQLITVFPEDINNHRSRAVSVSSDECGMYPELDLYADTFDVDPVLMRAIAWLETGLNDDTGGPLSDTCEASELPSCPNCLTSVVDPEGVCGTVSPGSSANKYIHSMGIMQVHTYPAESWSQVPGGDIHYEDEALWCGGEDFNPFNKENNLCLGAQIIMDKLRSGKEFVKNHESQLGLDQYEEGSEEYENMKYAIAIFVSSYYYSGATSISSQMDDWAYEFSIQQEVTDDYCSVAGGSSSYPCCDSEGNAITSNCCNNKVFVDYVAECKYDTLPSRTQQKANYGFGLLGRYRGLMQSCEQYDSESWREALEVHISEDMASAAASSPEGDSGSS